MHITRLSCIFTKIHYSKYIRTCYHVSENECTYVHTYRHPSAFHVCCSNAYPLPLIILLYVVVHIFSFPSCIYNITFISINSVISGLLNFVYHNTHMYVRVYLLLQMDASVSYYIKNVS